MRMKANGLLLGRFYCIMVMIKTPYCSRILPESAGDRLLVAELIDLWGPQIAIRIMSSSVFACAVPAGKYISYSIPIPTLVSGQYT